ncbi:MULTISPECIES: ATPase [unclassified Neptuniibacter]|jgi:V/A-type H+-transporting ATPase subunit E|uniref:ATPase n=1 Tax=unclassified Neptuniibacter TaxID=2630693 RepID=UPI0025EC6F73|nr:MULTISPECIES: ATPase [unclassified Neptuniibacter]|tara:strand:- start:3721 stop:4404 length:684 start_codon:yes stop_codon:yes gene_type:complete
MSSEQKTHASSGVEALIEKLRQQGVTKGQHEAEQLVEEAEHRADWLVSQAKQEAEQILSKAKKEAALLQQSGEDALRIAARDMHLEVRETLSHSFTDQVERLVAAQMDNAEFMRALILELASKVSHDHGIARAEQIDVLLPEDFIGLDELRRNPKEYREGKLSQFVQSLAAEQMRDGVNFALYEGKGIRVCLNGQEVEVDLSSEAVSKLLLKHLQPRFRAIIEGVIR